MEIFETEIKSINSIIEGNKISFVIPTYQRPYVWEDEEVLKLLQDIYNSSQNNNGKEHYFIGNVYVTPSLQENTFDVIDGQQRFTTIWLIALVFKQLNIESDIEKFLGNGNSLLLNFTIRKEVEHYLKSVIQGENQVFDLKEINENEFLKNIAKAIETIKGFIKQDQIKEPKEFAKYIYTNVTFVYNTAPKNTDLNSLFTALGNSGVQLEQTDILKSQLLKLVDNKVCYSKIWEACENMSDYFESNVLSIFSGTNRESLSENDFASFKENLFSWENNSVEGKSENGLSISQIIECETIKKHHKNNLNEAKEKKMRCRSIIPFSILLLHTYRIFLHQNKEEKKIDFSKPFDKKHLLEIFSELVKGEIESEEKIKSFFILLWKVRYLFDKHIVKWRSDNESDENSNDEEKLRLTTLNKIENSFVRQNKTHSDMSMLQSVLYFTNGFSQQYWLTPFLNYLLESNKEEADTLLKLEKMDNYFSLSKKTQKEISWELMSEQTTLTPDFAFLNESKGTKFKHYWFYKLEYLLWKTWDKNDNKIKQFRITSKNSIEHIFPQNDENKKQLSENTDENNKVDWLNSFGNLALLSTSENSSFSNQDVAKKKIDFDNKNVFSSLKLAKIYTYQTWNTEQIQEHQKKMIALLEDNYSKT